MEEQEKKNYELSLWFSPLLEEKELEKNFNDFLDYLISLKIELINTSFPEKKSFSYRLKKEKTGYFGFLVFKSFPEMITKIKERLKLEKNILRYLITKLVVLKTPVRTLRSPRSVFVTRAMSDKVEKEEKKEKKISLEELDQKLEALLKE